MSIELIRDIINFEKLVGEGSGQMMVNGDIILGERSPEIVNILHMDGKVIIGSQEAVDDMIVVEGKMNFEVLYSSNDENGGVYKVSAASNFNHNIRIPGTMPQMPCKIDTRIEHMDFDQISNRKIKVNAIININGMVYEKNTVEAITDIKAQDVQVLRNKVMVDEFVSENSGQSIIMGRFEIEDKKINSVLKSDVFIHKKDVSIEDGKVVINACARIKLLCDNDEGEIWALEQDVTFTSDINVPDMKPDMKCDVSFKIQDIYDEFKEDENGDRKSIETEVVIDVNAKAYAKKEMENVVDAYSPIQRYEMEKETVRAISYYGEGSESENIKEKISIQENAKPVEKVKNIIAKPVITDTKIVEDKVVVEGIVNCCLIYSVATEEGGLAGYLEDIPFKSSIDIPGTKIDMLLDLDVNACDMGFSVLPDKSIEVKMIVESMCKLYSKSMSDVSKGVVESELPESVKNMPTLVVYYVQSNDTLWKIAKKYSTTIEDIVRLNEIENPDVLQGGMKLLIPKKLFMK